jgi:hypothetical protein
VGKVSNYKQLKVKIINFAKVVKDTTMETKGMPQMPLMTSPSSANTVTAEVISVQV